MWHQLKSFMIYHSLFQGRRGPGHRRHPRDEPLRQLLPGARVRPAALLAQGLLPHAIHQHEEQVSV